MIDAEKQFDFEIVCPDKKVMEDVAWQVVVPGDEGDFGILSNHSAVVSSLRAGVVTIYQEKSTQIPERIFVSGGFVDVTSDACKILADEAVNVNDFDHGEIEKEIQNLNEDLGIAEGDHDKAKIEAKISLAKAKLSAVTTRLIV